MTDDVLKPADAAQVQEALSWALAQDVPLELLGRGTKQQLGRPVRSNARLDLSALAGVSMYEPEELVMTAAPATRLADIEATLAEKNQELAFEPPDLGALVGGAAGEGSIGGAFLCNLGGPRRFRAGAARDHLLGFKAVSGRAEPFKSGGRVVKNVTGYDLSKLICGSFGTLAAVTEVTFKVLPRAEKARTLLLYGLDTAAAVQALSEAAGSPHDVSGLAHLPAESAARSAVDYVSSAGASVTAVRLEGPGPSVEARLAALKDWFRRHRLEELHSMRSRTFWTEVRDVARYCGTEGPLWRLLLPPMAAAQVAAALTPLGGRMVFDWAGGLVWLVLPDMALHVAEVRAAAAAAGGHAMLVRAPRALREEVDVFPPESAGVRALSTRIKDSFDPRRILNPGRMWAGV